MKVQSHCLKAFLGLTLAVFAALPALGQVQRARSPTSSSSWATTSAGSTSAPTTRASWPAARRTSTSSPAEGMRFTDYYAEASCTAGRANFITGELPIRTGLTTVGQAGSPIGMPARGADDRHGAQVDGLCHRPVRQEPPRRPQRVPADGARLRRVLRLPLSPRRDGGPAAPATTRRRCKDTVGPRNMIHSWATNVDDPTVQPRWGKIGKQKIEDAGTLYPKRMETVDDEILDNALKFVDKAKTDNKPFFLWLNPTRMHVVTHLSGKYEKMRNSENGWCDPGGRHGAARRHRRLGHEVPQGQRASTTTRSSSSPPTTAPRTSPGPTAARRRSPAARARRWRAASACRRSSAGRARCRPARSRTASSPGSTGSRPSSPPPATRTSPTS